MNNHQIPQEQWEEIERFLLQRMSADEEAAFRERLMTDPVLQKETDDVKLLSIGIQEFVLEKKLNRFHEELPAQNLIKKNGEKIISIKTWLAAASVFIVIAVSAYFIFLKKNKEEALFAQYFQPDPGLITAMGTSSNYQLDRAMVDYKSGNYAAAIQTWEALRTVKPNNDTLNYFLGSAYLANDKTEEAIPHFEKVLASLNSIFVKDAYWYLALAELKIGNKQQALTYLEKSDHSKTEDLRKKLKE